MAHSFDYLSSSSPQKIRKGLRQVEGLLTQICMSKVEQPINKRHSMLALGSTSPQSSPKKLSDLQMDPAYREFFKLQQGFQWNVVLRLIGCLERLLGKESNGTNDLLVIQTLELIQGVLLLHPPSRDLFAREIYMNVRIRFRISVSKLTNLLAISRPSRSPKLSSHPVYDTADPRHFSSRLSR